jgi:hypothetical protein
MAAEKPQQVARTDAQPAGQAGVPGAASGRQRRQGRNPAASAAAGLPKNKTLARFA